MSEKPYFPMFVDLSEKKVMVVGAGTIAKRRIRTLAQFTNHLTVLAPEVNKELLEMEQEGSLKILKKHYEREDLFGQDMVVAATNDGKINHDIYAACKCLGIQVNVCSDKNMCDFFFPGVIRDDYLVVGVTASGRNHKLAKRTTEKVREALGLDADE